MALVLAGCANTVAGQAVSMLYDPARVGGLPVTDGTSGPGDDVPAPTGTVGNTDGGEIDRLALLSINDLEDYWQHNYAGLPGDFTPLDTLISYDSTDPAAAPLCGLNTYQYVNAFFCYGHNVMAWDRGKLLPAGQRYFGDMAITGVLAHEYGHAVEDMAHLVDGTTPTLVAEQQADCFAGVYLRWVAEGNSSRFTLSTTDGLDGLLAGLITLRDPVLGPDDKPVLDENHGTALDRISAFQTGFDTGAMACLGIDTDEIEARRGDMPMSLHSEPTGGLQTGEVEIDKDTLSSVMEVLNTSFAPAAAPALSFAPTNCPDTEGNRLASYCPATNTISVDLPALRQLSAVGDDAAHNLMPRGDNTALSLVMSRYMLALQHARGAELTSAMTGLRTACLTGVGQRTLSEPVAVPHGTGLVLTAGDLDEAVTGLLTNGLAASDVNGAAVPAGFTRILAFRSGLRGDTEQCYQRFR